MAAALLSRFGPPRFGGFVDEEAEGAVGGFADPDAWGGLDFGGVVAVVGDLDRGVG